MRAQLILLIFFLPLFFAPNSSGKGGAKQSKTAKLVEQLQSTIGTCSNCRLNGSSRDAGDAPLGTTTLKDLHGRKIEVSAMNDEYALKLFQELTVQQKIPFGYPEDGCYARAHEMAYQLNKKSISTGKIFAHGFFRVDDDNAKAGYVSWAFHVAPFVVIDNGHKREIGVIDPSLFFEPVSLKKWLDKLSAHAKSKISKVYLTSRFNYHWQDRDQAMTNFDDEDLASARRTMKRFLKREDLRVKTKTPDL